MKNSDKIGVLKKIYGMSLKVLRMVIHPVFVSLVLLGTFCVFLYYMHLSIQKDSHFVYGKNTLKLKNDVPRWVEKNGLTSKIRLNTKEISDVYYDRSVFLPETLPKLHTALMETHWVKNVSLEKQFPSTIAMTVDFRRPIAAVLQKKFWYILDEECHLIPIVERKGSEMIDVVRLTNMPFLSEKLKPGVKVENDSVSRAVKLSILITDRFTLPGKLLRIELLPDTNMGNRFQLFFQSGLDVLWGNFLEEDEVDRFPDKYLSSEEKLKLLNSKLNKDPSVLHLNVEFFQ